MTSQQIVSDERMARRNERRRQTDRLIERVRAGVTQRAPYGEGSLWRWEVRDLERQFWGMRKHLSTKLVERLGDREGEALMASLFERGGLRANRARLRTLNIDRLAARAVKVSELIDKADEALTEVEKARREYDARRKAEQEAEQARHDAELDALARQEEARQLSQDDVIALIRGAGYTGSLWGPVELAFNKARELDLITEVEYRLAQRSYGRMFTFFD